MSSSVSSLSSSLLSSSLTAQSATQNITGLASGLDTNSIVSALMNVAAQPKVRLQQQQAVERVRQQALSDVQSQLVTLQSAITGIRDIGTWGDTQAVDSSDPTKLVATRTAGAAAGAFQIAVTDLARADQYKSGTLTTVTNAGPLTVTVGSASVSVDVTAGDTLDTIATAINRSSGTPVYASVVNNQLVLSGQKTGAANSISIGGNSALTAELGFTHSITAADAHYSVDGEAKTSSSNTVADALPGIQMVLKAATSSPVTVAVGAPTPNTSTIQTAIESFVKAYNSTLDFIQAKVNEKPVPSPQNDADRAKGVLHSDSALTGLLSSMRTAVADIFQGRPGTMMVLSQAGLSTGAAVGTGTISQDSISGKLSLDSTKLASALSTSLTDVKALFTNVTGKYATEGLGQRLDGLVFAQVKPSGALSSRIASSGTAITEFSKSIADWDIRLATKQQTLQQQFTNMETALANAQSQGNWISGQIAKM